MSDAPSVAAGTRRGSARRSAVRLVPPRNDRLQICVSREEKAQIWEQARRAHCETLSEFARARLFERDEKDEKIVSRRT